jgi:hypothetical protein
MAKMQKKNQFLYDHIIKLQTALAHGKPKVPSLDLHFGENKSFSYSGQSRRKKPILNFEVESLKNLQWMKGVNTKIGLKKRNYEELMDTTGFTYTAKNKFPNTLEIQNMSPICHRSLKKVKIQEVESFKSPEIEKPLKCEINFNKIQTFLKGFQTPLTHILSDEDFLQEFEEIYKLVTELLNIQTSNKYNNQTKIEDLFICKPLSLELTLLDPQSNSNTLKKIDSDSKLTVLTTAIILILVLINFNNKFSNPVQKVTDLVNKIASTEDYLVGSPFTRILNMIFKKSVSKINNQDVEQILFKITNSFGYLSKLFSQFLFLAEQEIIFNNSDQMNLNGFMPSKITQSSTFKGACSFYLKKNLKNSSQCSFFVNLQDLLSSSRLTCDLPCMANLNHRHVGLLRDYLSAPKFWGSEQQKVFMYLAREIPLPQ